MKPWMATIARKCAGIVWWIPPGAFLASYLKDYLATTNRWPDQGRLRIDRGPFFFGSWRVRSAVSVARTWTSFGSQPGTKSVSTTRQICPGRRGRIGGDGSKTGRGDVGPVKGKNRQNVFVVQRRTPGVATLVSTTSGGLVKPPMDNV